MSTDNRIGRQWSNYAVYRWIVWSILALIYLIVFFHRMSVGVIREELMAEFDMTSAAFAAFGSIYFYVYMCMQIPSGILADTLGARKTVMLGAAVASIGSILFAMATNLPLAYIGRFLVGMGVSVVFIPILKIQSCWFHEREFGTMTGLTTFVGNLGSVLAQTPLAFLVAMFSWRTTFIGIGVFTFVLSVLCFLLVRNTPEEAGFPPVSESSKANTKNQKINFKKAFAEVLKNKSMCIPSILYFAVFGAQVAFTGTFGQQYLMGLYGFDKTEASTYTLICALSVAIGAVIVGRWSDKIERRKPFVIVTVAMNLVGWAVLVFLGGENLHPVLLRLCMVLIGAACSIMVLCFSIVKEINSPEFVGVSISVINIFGFTGAAIIPIFVGKILDKYAITLTGLELYSKAFMICFFVAIIAMIASFFVKETGCKNISEKN